MGDNGWNPPERHFKGVETASVAIDSIDVRGEEFQAAAYVSRNADGDYYVHDWVATTAWDSMREDWDNIPDAFLDSRPTEAKDTWRQLLDHAVSTHVADHCDDYTWERDDD